MSDGAPRNFHRLELDELLDNLIDALRWPRWFDTMNGEEWAQQMREELQRRRTTGELPPRKTFDPVSS